MGQVSSAFNHDDGVQVPDDYITPTWPSLYIPTISSTFDQQGIFLYEAEAIWRFTFYWTIALLGSIFLVSGLLAALSSFLSLTIFRPSPKTSSVEPFIPPTPLTTLPSTPSPGSSFPNSPTTPASPGVNAETPLVPTRTRPRRKRPPLWPVILVPFVMVAIAALVSLVSATVVGFALAAIYSAGAFSMSTWVPLLWALIQVLVLIVSSYSTLTSIL